MHNKVLFWVGIALVVASLVGPVAQSAISDGPLGQQTESDQGFDMPMYQGDHMAPWMYDGDEGPPPESGRRGPSTDQARPFVGPRFGPGWMYPPTTRSSS